MHYLNEARKIIADQKRTPYERYREMVDLGASIQSAAIRNEPGESRPGEPLPPAPSAKEISLEILIASLSYFHRLGLDPKYWSEICAADLKALGAFIESDLVFYRDGEKLAAFVDARRAHKAQLAKIAATGDFSDEEMASWDGSGT